jgi:uncharacterized phage protein (TIGR01671 family)
MREIKYRAWDKTDKKMIFWNSLLNGHNLRNVFMRPEMCGLILMQYTGLKDKNGVEVYEGDIVRCSRGCPHEVIWLEEYGGTFVGGMPVWYLSGLMEGYAWTGEEEVLGNIYANPELLKESGANE